MKKCIDETGNHRKEMEGKTKRRTTLLGLRFALLPTYCRECGRKLWFCFFYGLSFFTYEAYDIHSPSHTHHCVSCHKKTMKKKGVCSHCDSEVKEYYANRYSDTL